MVKVRRDVVEVKVRIGKAVDVEGMTRMTAKGGGDEERRCDSIARLNLIWRLWVMSPKGVKLATQGRDATV